MKNDFILFELHSFFKGRHARIKKYLVDIDGIKYEF